VDVELHYTDSTLQLSIRDNGPGPTDIAGHGLHGHDLRGHGLLGMSERAAAVGGTLTTGRASGGGFLVRATLPAKEEAG
jgi:signal transduction histidine kinase